MKAGVNGNAGGPTTIAPALVLNKNGTKMMQSGGTVKPIPEDKAKELMDKAKNNPDSVKVETFTSVREYDEFIKEKNSTLTSKRQLHISGRPQTTPAARPAPGASASTTSPQRTTNAPGAPSRGPTAKALPAAATGSATTTKPSPSAARPGAPTTTTTKAPSSPAKLGTTQSPPTTTSAPSAAKAGPQTRVPVGSTTSPSCPACPACPASGAAAATKKPGCPTLPMADFQASDRLLAVAITNKGYFKGRRISAKAIEAIMRPSLGVAAVGADKGLTISTNNSFVFPAGHYYFPQPIRFAGFHSP